MSARELRASFSLASIFGLRLFGMFIVLPVFSLHVEKLPGWDLTLAGIALGAYGLTQAALQVPFGWASDRLGRKPVIAAGLVIFAAGSAVCALAEAPWAMILGRTIQGAGAISAAALALAADLTRPSQRTKSMAIIGSSIGLAFTLSFVAGPFLQRSIGVPGIFAMTGLLALAGIAVVAWVVPAPERLAPRGPQPPLSAVLLDPELARLNLGIFVLQAVLMALFVVLPFSLVRAGLPAGGHWSLYLAAVGIGFVLMLPFVAVRSIARHERAVFLGSIAVLGVAFACFFGAKDRYWPLATGLVIFFAAFNVLEAKVPALVSKAAPPSAKGAATGVYSGVQFLGTFFGAAAGGLLAQHAGGQAVLFACLVAIAGWLVAAWPKPQARSANADPQESHVPQATHP